MAEALFESRLMRDHPSMVPDVEASSCGIAAIEGNAATEHAVRTMDLWDIDLETHRASELTTLRLSEADLVVAMAREHLLAVGRLHPGALARSTTIATLAGMAGEVSRSLGDDTVYREKEARRRLKAVLGLLRDRFPQGDFLADMQEHASDIIDPIGRSLQVYIKVAEELDAHVGALMGTLFGRPESPDLEGG